jgi:hypothetical protein
MATRKGKHGKTDDHYLVMLQWIGCEDLVNDFADWVNESTYDGPVFCFDSFGTQKSRLTAPRPDNYPAPEPSTRLRVDVGFRNIPQPASLIYVGNTTPRKVTNQAVKDAPAGCFVIFNEGDVGIARKGIPLLHCGSQVAAMLL